MIVLAVVVSAVGNVVPAVFPAAIVGILVLWYVERKQH